MKYKNWPETTCTGDFKRLRIIQDLFTDFPDMVDWLFKTDKPEIFDEPEVVLAKAGALSSGQQILVQMALAIWCWHDGPKIVDVCRRLDGKNFKAVLEAMCQLRNI